MLQKGSSEIIVVASDPDVLVLCLSPSDSVQNIFLQEVQKEDIVIIVTITSERDMTQSGIAKSATCFFATMAETMTAFISIIHGLDLP